MNDLIERYIYDVARRLPEKERSEVRRELEANIIDMLPDNPGELDIADTLTKLGPPRAMAEQYRQTPRYLISPSIFELYISVLKSVTAVIAVICGCIGAFSAVLSVSSASVVFTAAISTAIGGVLQAAFWTTFGFAMADRRGLRQTPWTVSDLPRLPDNKGVKIPRRRSIIGLILSVFFTVLLITMILRGSYFIILTFHSQIVNPFSQAAVARFIPYILILGCLGLAMNGLKLYWAKWNLPLCALNIIHNVLWVGIVIYILHWPGLFSEEFIALSNTLTGDADLLRFIQSGGTVLFFSAAFVLAGVVDIAASVWNTWKGLREPA